MGRLNMATQVFLIKFGCNQAGFLQGAVSLDFARGTPGRGMGGPWTRGSYNIYRWKKHDDL
jgi:hypothetical protein